MDLRNQEFEDKMADYADRYPDNLDTLVTRFQSLLRTYSGRKKIDPGVSQKVFAKYIEPLLRKKLNASSGSPEDVQALHDLILNISNGLPSEYKGINNLMALDIKKAADARATSVHDTLTEARDAYNQKDFVQSQQLWNVADQNRKRLLTEFNGNVDFGITGYYDMLSNNLHGSDDVSNANLIPSVKALFTTMDTENRNFLNVNGNSSDPNSGGRSDRGTGSSPGTASTQSAPNTSSTGPSLPVSFGTMTQNQVGNRPHR